MIEKDLDKVLNYMKQYVENVYEHDSEPMLNYKDIQLVLEEIERLNNIINDFEEELEREINIKEEDAGVEHNTYIDIRNTLREVLKRFRELKGSESNE